MATSHATSSGSYFFRACAVGLISAALGLSGVQLYKYKSAYTAVVHRAEERHSLFLPSIGFCPGFLPDALERYPWLRPRMEAALPEDLDSVWEEIALDLEDFLMWVDLQNGTEMTTYGAADFPALRSGALDCVRVDELSSVRGKCFVARFSCPSGKKSPVFFTFNLTGVFGLSLDLHFFRPRASVGLATGVWPRAAPVSVVTVEADSSNDVTLTKKVKTVYATNSDEKGYFDCIDDLLARDVDGLFEAGRICYSPEMRHLLSMSSHFDQERIS